jgi:hypothetical protein
MNRYNLNHTHWLIALTIGFVSLLLYVATHTHPQRMGVDQIANKPTVTEGASWLTSCRFINRSAPCKVERWSHPLQITLPPHARCLIQLDGNIYVQTGNSTPDTVLAYLH